MDTLNLPEDSLPYEGPWIPLANMGMWLIDGPRSLVQSSDLEGLNGLFLAPVHVMRLGYWDFSTPVPNIVIYSWILFRRDFDFEPEAGTRWILRAAEWNRGGDRDRWKAQEKRLDRLSLSVTHLCADDAIAAKFEGHIRHLGWQLLQDFFGVRSRNVEITDPQTRFEVGLKYGGRSVEVNSTVFKQDSELFTQMEQLHRDLTIYERSAGRVNAYHEVFEWRDSEPKCILSVGDLPYAFDCYDWEAYWKWRQGGDDPLASEFS